MDSLQNGETQPTPVQPDGDTIQIRPAEGQDPAIEAARPASGGDDAFLTELEEHTAKNRLWILWAFLGVLGLMAVAGLSIYAGYRSAIRERTGYQSTQVAGEAQAQFDLALEDIAAKNYDLARQRLEYVIQLDPGFPNAQDKLAFVLLEQRITATPTLMPTPTLTPTPDLRGRDELLSQAQLALLGGEWDNAIETLLVLRKKYPDFNAIKVDGMLYVALRNRGVNKIANQADLEGGNYDLTLAEKFGPLDAEAKNWRDWAELYIRGAGYWDVDWAQVVSYFSQLAPVVPYLRDASGFTAIDRYIQALAKYGDWLALQGEWCQAQDQYDLAQELRPAPQLEPTASYAGEQCAEGGDQGDGNPEPTPADTTPAPPPTVETPPPAETPVTTPYP